MIHGSFTYMMFSRMIPNDGECQNFLSSCNIPFGGYVGTVKEMRWLFY